jgi:hypothetical protein
VTAQFYPHQRSRDFSKFQLESRSWFEFYFFVWKDLSFFFKSVEINCTKGFCCDVYSIKCT